MNIFSQKIPTNFQEEIKELILQKFDAIVNPKQYAFWEIKHKEFTAVFYNSSKLVVQGKNIALVLEVLAAKFPKLPFEIKSEEKQAENSQKSSVLKLPKLPYIGTDESGKGDFFGPLVIAGVCVDEKNINLFKELGIKDSKTLKDEQMIKMALQIQKHSVHSVIAISNAKYNELYKKFKNLNKLLAWGHARVIENILERCPCDYALSDKFGDESLIKNALMKQGQTINLEQRVRAESDIAVAAASVLARATYVQKMSQMEKFYSQTFPKGCNSHVKTSASEFISKYGKERLHEVCKAHFKTFNEV